MQETVSEKRFQEYCAARDYSCERIVAPPNTGRFPDFRVSTTKGVVICELKQIEPNEWDIQKEKELEKHGTADVSRAIGWRARSLITDAAPQLKRFKDDPAPAVLVGFDMTWNGYLDPVDIDAAMFGQPMFRWNIARSAQEDVNGAFVHGGKRQMTEDNRRYISAFAVLGRNELTLQFFHNPFATKMLWPDYFPDLNDKHFIKGGHPEMVNSVWNEYVGPRTRP